MRDKKVNEEAEREPLYFSHKTQRITIRSYLLEKGDWVPKAWINTSAHREHQGQLIVDDVDHPLPTKDAADAVAKKLAIEWIDSQFPSVAD
jgi:hypothetical protein